MAAKHYQQHHFLIVTYPAQGHITPARHLARRLGSVCRGARVTICAPLSAFRKMFPGAAGVTVTEEECGDGDAKVKYVAYSDGYDGGFDIAVDSYARYMEQARMAGSRSLAGVLRRLRDDGRPVTCAVYTLLLPWVAGVARDHGVAATAVFWIQPATALTAYYHYFRGHRDAVVAAAASGDPCAEVGLPGLPPLRVRDLPSFLAVTSEDDPFAFVLPEFGELVDALERDDGSSEHPTYVLANTCDAMEPDALASLRPHVDVFPVKRPFLLVLRKDSRKGHDDDAVAAADADSAGGMVVEWCDQARVLSHPAVACFVTHCGWNSTLESAACGVPTVAVPQYSDQGTAAWLVAERMGTGVRAAARADGVVEAQELRRCVEAAASGAVAARAAAWKRKAWAAVADGGSSHRNLTEFLRQIGHGRGD
ncbi:UDP-glycosyltransferase 75B1 [Zea mays]|uniref:Glycosyltransferase n=1 Tax=Zea mays TaxID=4577 RepID=A0A1D6LZZ8_MAIZE|nr:UDP-glycosyltransferase 75B1 [Zea mays]